MSRESVLGFIGVLLVAFMGANVGYHVSKETTSNYWQTEAVKRGFATWETTTNGKVWFRWKEEMK